jgi:hypothetical protein
MARRKLTPCGRDFGGVDVDLVGFDELEEEL